MRQFYTCLLLLLTGIGLNTYAQISINIVSPVAPYIVDTAVNVQVAVTSTYSIASVKAAVNGRQTTLTPAYRGRINIADLPFDTLLLTITVTDVLGNIKDTSINIIHDSPPVLVTDSLLPYAVATPNIHIKASASDNAAIDSITVSGDGFSFIFPGNSIDTTINMLNTPVPDGSGTYIRITATDNRNQKATRQFTIYVEKSEYLERVYTSPYRGRIVDFKDNKVLISDPDSFHHRIIDIQTNVMTELPVHKPLFPQQAFLTPYGAFFAAYHPSGLAVDSIYEWNNGAIVLKVPGYVKKVVGNYAIWFGGSSNYFRDFSTGLNHEMGQIYVEPESALAENGLAFVKAVFSEPDLPFYYYTNAYYQGQETELPFLTGDFPYQLVATDGKELYFGQSGTGPQGQGYYLYKTTNNYTSYTLFSTLYNFDSQSLLFKNGYMAYVRRDSSGTDSHVYLRDSTGHEEQKNYWTGTFDVSERIKLLDSTGNIVFLEYGDPSVPIAGYYYAGRDGSLLKLTDYVGPALEGNAAFLDNGQFYMAIGNALFKVNTVAQEGLTSFHVDMKQDSVHHFTQEDFTANSIAPVVNVKIVSTPSHGVLAVNGRTITANNIVVADSLHLLTYTPAAGYSGADTVVWNASSNGSTYAANNALITFSIASDSLQVPLVTGLSTQYCGNAGEVSGTIVNPPAPDVTVTVMLDNTGLGTSDHIFRFDPGTLAGGAHQIKVTYANAGDTTSTTINFTVIPVTVPDLTLTANITTVNTTSDTVIITAQVPVGYKNALYTFAWDPNFSNLIQWESVNNIVTIAPDAFAVGNNTVYAKVRTGNACSSSITATDSIVITRSIVTAVPDTDVPGKMIIAYPNPFNGPVTIKGFQINKQYTLSLFDMQGRLILKKRVYQQSKTEINVQGKGNYILQINDDTKKRLLGSLQIIRI